MTKAEALRIAQRIRSNTATEAEVLATIDLVAAALTKAPGQIFDPPPLILALHPRPDLN